MTTETTPTQNAAVAPQGAQDAPKRAAATKTTTKKPNAPKAKHARKATKKDATKHASKKAAKPAAKKDLKKADAAVPREFSKKAIVLDLLRRKDGATMAEIAKATGWQGHSIRGFVSGQLTKKMGLNVESSKNANGERTYRIAK